MMQQFLIRTNYYWMSLRSLWHRLYISLCSRGWISTYHHIKQRLATRHYTLNHVAIPNLSKPIIFKPFAIPTTAEHPLISIIIPVYNQFTYTHQCLLSIAKHAGTLPFELIIIDDHSSDETVHTLAKVSGINVIQLSENKGFIHACNTGAQHAQGSYLVFLNNDTIVTSGWLETLYQTFELYSDCGMVGAKLIYPNGQLQEAGGIVFSDGSAHNYGRFTNPNHDAFNYIREVDYCSGAAIMISTMLFKKTAGFDPYYQPAYYEDVDLAFKVREQHLKVYYQPQACIIHREGTTSGTDLTSGVKRYQAINQGKFSTRWQAELLQQPDRNLPPDLACMHHTQKCLLIIDAHTPTPDRDSGSLRLIHIMHILSNANWRIIFCTEHLTYQEKYTQKLQQLGIEVLYRPHTKNIIPWLKKRGHTLQAVMLCRHYVAIRYYKLIRQYAPQSLLIFDTIDLHYLREQRAAKFDAHMKLRQSIHKTKQQELHLIKKTDITLVVSDAEKEILRKEQPDAHIEVLSNIHHPIEYCIPFLPRKDIFFVGGFHHPPNTDAMQWFLTSTWPLIYAALPNIRFHIIGTHPPSKLQIHANEHVIFHDYVEDITPFLTHCRVAIAPLRYGAGVKGKINQSMAYGQPVVATTIAAEGTHAVHNHHVLIADEPNSFAQCVIQCYTDINLWQKLSIHSVENIKQHFSFKVAQHTLRKILNDPMLEN